MTAENIEKIIRSKWNTDNIYKWDANELRSNSFIIDTPPPTVSGTLHIGHIFSYSHIDFIARFQRMIGKNIFFPIGFDDNGLPTERLVEKYKGVKASNLTRQDFVKLCQDVIRIEEEKFKELFQIMGYSFDWDLEYQTISQSTCHISQLSFLDLLKKGQIYRKAEPVLWDPVDQTALAQAEIQDKEQVSYMNEIRFELEDGSSINIATTRPELLPACVAVLVNPNDERYKTLIGKNLITALFKSKVSIIADPDVIIDKGTGAVMCCTFGDVTDIAWWRKYTLATKIILDKTGKIAPFEFNSNNSQNPEMANFYYAQLKGLKITTARAKIIEMLQNQQILLNQQEVTQTVKCAERSGAPLEILVSEQWFVKTIEHKNTLLELSKQLNWHPKYMQNRLQTWINSISWDWCISRQRFFGVPFPVWYSKRAGEEGKIIVADVKSLPIDPINSLPDGYSAQEVIADTDVMDTWATSCVSPQINSHAINTEFYVDFARHKQTFPADLRPQAHEIIRIWAFGTILKSYLHQGVLPWNNIMISGWCLAQDKTKMSKSKGNIIDPIQLIQTHSVDAIRYWASTSKLGSDTSYSQDVVLNGKKLINKLRNAAKFANMHFSKVDIDTFSVDQMLEAGQIFCTTDLWIINKLNIIANKAKEFLLEFEYCDAREVVEKFFWKDFCDTYLELVKTRLYNDENHDTRGQISGIYTLHHCLMCILKLFAPFLPYITEELWLEIFKKNTSIHIRNNWPDKINIIFDESSSIEELIFDILNQVRKIKTQKQLSIKAPIALIEIFGSKVILSKDLISDLMNITCAEQIIQLNDPLQVDAGNSFRISFPN